MTKPTPDPTLAALEEVWAWRDAMMATYRDVPEDELSARICADAHGLVDELGLRVAPVAGSAKHKAAS